MMFYPLIRLFFISSILTVVYSKAVAGERDTVYLQAQDDATLYEDRMGALANGSGQHLFVGRTDSSSGGAIRRTIIRFDIANNIPAGAFISEAELTLHMSQTASDSQLVALHQLTSMWVEGPSDPPGGEGGGAPPIRAMPAGSIVFSPLISGRRRAETSICLWPIPSGSQALASAPGTVCTCRRPSATGWLHPRPTSDGFSSVTSRRLKPPGALIRVKTPRRRFGLC